MEISLRKTEVMVVNSDGPSDIILNGAKIKKVRSFNYLGRPLNVEGEISDAVSNNCRKARTAIVKNETSTNKQRIESQNESKVSRDLYQAHSTVWPGDSCN